MRHLSTRSRITLGIATAVAAASAFAVNAQAAPGDAPAKKTEAAAPSGMNGPYLYLGWGNPPDAAQFLQETGNKQLTMAFILAQGGCTPAWDGQRPLKGGQDEQTINAVKEAGGDITPSFGGWSGNKLEEACGSAEELAAAYQEVIDAYGLKSIDIDIESTAVESEEVRQRTVDALKIVQGENADVKIYLTFGTTPAGPNANGEDLIKKGAEAGLDAAWAVMPFDYSDGTTDMVGATKSSVDGLKDMVKGAYGISDEEAYQKVGFSSMNGVTDVEGESIAAADFQQMVDYAKEHKLARVSFWAVNRDRPCEGGGEASASCSGIDQGTWEFSKILAGYQG
ncbi:chitinase [Streptomyces sp. Z26]|uniref:chitinase n=1 Tax=Streptomyces sp. Z26 TaxID=2500177 RepID=UPI000EF14CB6|nr:chitinase [Streptomyces sp. Z26]RLL68967.1 chitinase [Streptomyces sp. Z26]